VDIRDASRCVERKCTVYVNRDLCAAFIAVRHKLMEKALNCLLKQILHQSIL
jgi:hypothetical protein